MLVDRGVLTPDETGYRATGPVVELDVPETLHGLIAARLDGLASDERRLVQDAAVLGKTFAKEALATVAGTGEQAVDELLGSLVRKEILTVQADPLSPERGQYAFLGDLVRFVAYEMLSKKERKARHLAVAAYLESAFDEEDVVEVVASHYLQAYEAAPDAADRRRSGCERRNAVAAGERAASLAAAGEAKRYFEQAAGLTDTTTTRAALLARAGDMAWLSGVTEEAKSAYELAITLLEAEGASHAAARVSASYAEVIWYTDRNPELAVERMERAFDDLAGDEPDEDVAMLAAQLGRFLFFAGRADAAAERLNRPSSWPRGCAYRRCSRRRSTRNHSGSASTAASRRRRCFSITRSRSRSRTTSAPPACAPTTTFARSTA